MRWSTPNLNNAERKRDNPGNLQDQQEDKPMVQTFRMIESLHGPLPSLRKAIEIYEGSKVKVDLQTEGGYNDLVTRVVIEGPSKKAVNDCWTRLKTWNKGIKIKITFPTDKYPKGGDISRAIDPDLVKKWGVDYHDRRTRQVKSLTGRFAAEGIARALAEKFDGRIEKL